MSDPFFPDPWRHRRHNSYSHHRGPGGFFDDPLVGMGFPFDRGNMFDDVGNGRSRVYSQTMSREMAPDGRWVSESRVTRTINGVTESVWKRRDATVRPFTSRCGNPMLTRGHCTQGNEYATYTYPDGRERHTVNGREQITAQKHAQKHVQPQRVHTAPQPPPPIQTSVAVSPPPPYSASSASRKRDSPTSSSSSSRKRDSPNRELHSPIEIQSSSHAGSPPPVNHHYRSPSIGKSRVVQSTMEGVTKVVFRQLTMTVHTHMRHRITSRGGGRDSLCLFVPRLTVLTVLFPIVSGCLRHTFVLYDSAHA